MTNRKLLMTVICFSLTMAQTAWAGEWKQQPNYSYEYRELWAYQKDDGLMAESEWLLINGTWYYFGEDGYLPTVPGYAPDGSCYNAKGEYIDLADGRSFITKEAARPIQVGMSYNEIVSLIGKEHETVSYEQKQVGLATFTYRTLKWYSKDLKYGLIINFTNDVSDDKTFS